jgi:pantothenate kinase
VRDPRSARRSTDFIFRTRTLELLGLRSVKGAPQTSDAATFMALLRRLREEPAAIVLWPDFDRLAEATVPEAIPIGAELVARSRRLADRVILP